MREVKLSVSYSELDSVSELPESLQQLLQAAGEAVEDSYAPYSKFRVGAAALLENGMIVKGSNQENASSPVGICAERVTLSAVSALHPNVAVIAIAITAKAKDHLLDGPVAPCGLCRQTLLEYEERFKKPIELILQGETGIIFRFTSAGDLLPHSFGKDDLPAV